jgi:hypothetical protein
MVLRYLPNPAWRCDIYRLRMVLRCERFGGMGQRKSSEMVLLPPAGPSSSGEGEGQETAAGGGADPADVAEETLAESCGEEESHG